MTRPARLVCLAFLFFPIPVVADPAGSPPAVRQAMTAAREHLAANRAGDAVAVLEAELLNANGDGAFLALLREAYVADLRDLQARKGDDATVDLARRRLRALDAKATDLGPAPPTAGRPEAAAIVRAPAPPIPDPPADAPAATVSPAAGVVAPPVPAAPGGDPFQQPLRTEPAAPPTLPRASEAFAARQYGRAAELFAEADRRKEPFTAAQRDEWAYARLHGVAMRLNKSPGADADLAREVTEAMKSGSEHVTSFGNRLLAEIRRRAPSTPGPASGPAGWTVVETPSFRVLHHGQPAVAAEVGQTAEAARRAMYERWAGPPAAEWAPKCDLYLHPTAAEYTRATGKAADQPGHSTVRIQGGKVVGRRIDLRLDEPTTMDRVLPSEVTQVVLADLFADEPLPRWAVVGMAGLAESPEGVARYLRAVPALYHERKLVQVGGFLEQAAFPDPAAVTAFYAESVSLVSFLVELKGPRAFTAFLREAPRRGYGRALTAHYGFKDAGDLQEQWVRHSAGRE